MTGILLKSGDKNWYLKYKCPKCDKDILTNLKSGGPVGDFNERTHDKFGCIEARSCQCGQWTGWLTIRFVDGFPKADDVAKGAEVEFEVVFGPAPSE